RHDAPRRIAAIDGASRRAPLRAFKPVAAALRRKFESRGAHRRADRRAADKRTVADRIAVWRWVEPATAKRLWRIRSRRKRRERGDQRRRDVLHAPRETGAGRTGHRLQPPVRLLG